jgi:hypothetical protein
MSVERQKYFLCAEEEDDDCTIFLCNAMTFYDTAQNNFAVRDLHQNIGSESSHLDGKTFNSDCTTLPQLSKRL